MIIFFHFRLEIHERRPLNGSEAQCTCLRTLCAGGLPPTVDVYANCYNKHEGDMYANMPSLVYSFAYKHM